jgi:hypothetical protein
MAAGNYRGILSVIAGSNGINSGMLGAAIGGGPGENNGELGTVANSVENYGVSGLLTSENPNPSSLNNGVYAESGGSPNLNIGLQAIASGTNQQRDTSFNVGVFTIANRNTNRPNIGLFSSATNGEPNFAGVFVGNVQIAGNLTVSGNIAKGGGTFKIDHPFAPTEKLLVHSFVESPDMLNIYSGNVQTDANGYATVELPDYFEAINTDFRYNLTCIGTFAQAIVKEEIRGNRFVIQTSQPNVKVSWMVQSVRNDPYAKANRIVPVQDKKGLERGRYIHPELYVQPANDYQSIYKLPIIKPRSAKF